MEIKQQERLLRKALHAFRLKDYTLCIRLLEKEIFHFRTDEQYFLLLGIASLKVNDFNGAQTYLQRALQIQNTPNNQHMMALLLVLSGKHDEATHVWLEILDKDPQYILAKKGLNSLRRFELPQERRAWLAVLNKELYPIREYSWLSHPRNWWILLSLALLASVGLFFYQYPQWYHSFFFRQQTSAVSVFDLPDTENLIEQQRGEGQFRYIFSAQQIRLHFSRAQSYIEQGLFNRAQMEINRILYSNASEDAKRQTYALTAFMQRPQASSWREEDTLHWNEVLSEPHLHEDVFIRWQGQVRQWRDQASAPHFFLALYDRQNTVVHSLLTRVWKRIQLNEDALIELTAQVRINRGRVELDYEDHRIIPRFNVQKTP